MQDDQNQQSETVGYKNPPATTRFKPGQSGNPKGRPKGSKNFGTVLEEELNSTIAVHENGKRKKISKRAAVAKQLVNKAVSGELRAMPLVLQESRTHEQEVETAATVNRNLKAEDRQIMENFLKRLPQVQAPVITESESSDPNQSQTK